MPSTTDIILACATCGAQFIPVGGQVVLAVVDLIKLAEVVGWVPNGRGGHDDPTCAKAQEMTGVQSGVSAAIAGALTAERAHATLALPSPPPEPRGVRVVRDGFLGDALTGDLKAERAHQAKGKPP